MITPSPLHSGCVWFTRSADLLRRSDFRDLTELPETATLDDGRLAHNDLVKRLRDCPSRVIPVIIVALSVSFSALADVSVTKRTVGSLSYKDEVVVDVTGGGGGGGGGGVDTNAVEDIVRSEVPEWSRRVTPQVSDGVATPTWTEGKIADAVTTAHRDATNVVTLATNGLARAADIPTSVSRLTNDIGYVTASVTNGIPEAMSMIESRTNEWNSVTDKANRADLDGYVPWANVAHNAVTIGSRKSGSAIGAKSLAQGENVEATGDYSHAAGGNTHAVGKYSRAEGVHSHAEGAATHAEGAAAHAEGYYSHAEGDNTHAEGSSSHAEGDNTHAEGISSHAEGKHARAKDFRSFVFSGVTVPKTYIWKKLNTPIFDVDERCYHHGFIFRSKKKSPSGHEPPVIKNSYGRWELAPDYETNEWWEYMPNEKFYESNGEGTFNINPVGGLSGFWVGETNMAQHIKNLAGGGGGSADPSSVTNIVKPMIEDATNGLIRTETDPKWTAEKSGYVPWANDEHNAVTIIGDRIPGSAIGEYSLAQGYRVKATTNYTHAEGGNTHAEGSYSHSEGWYTHAGGFASHAEGDNTHAEGSYSHSEGWYTHAGGFASHAEGANTLAKGDYTHAEGGFTTAGKNPPTGSRGTYAHAAGFNAQAVNTAAFAWNGSANDDPSTNSASATYVPPYGDHGNGTYNLNPVGGLSGFWVGETNMADHIRNLAGGVVTNTVEKIVNPMIEDATNGLIRTETDPKWTAEKSGYVPWANDEHNAVTIGYRIGIIGANSLAQGYKVDAPGDNTHAEGRETFAFGECTHAEGDGAFADGYGSHAEGRGTKTEGYYTHAEGIETHAEGDSTHAEGDSTHAEGSGTHAEGVETHAEGSGTHAEGGYTTAGKSDGNKGSYAHASGFNAYATNVTAFTWNGSAKDKPSTSAASTNYVHAYGDHGNGTYNLNPVGGLSGFWVGETNMAQHIKNLAGGGGGSADPSSVTNIVKPMISAATNGLALAADANFAAKVPSATAGNIASFASGGDIGDSGYKPDDFLKVAGGTMSGDITFDDNMVYDIGYLGVTGSADIDGDLEVSGDLDTAGYVVFREGMEIAGDVKGGGGDVYGFKDATFSGDVTVGRLTAVDVFFDGGDSLKNLNASILGKASRDNVSSFSPETSTVEYKRWELRRRFDSGSEALYMALHDTAGAPVTDTTVWRQVSNASIPLSLFAKELFDVTLKASNPAFATEVNRSISSTNENFAAQVRAVDPIPGDYTAVSDAAMTAIRGIKVNGTPVPADSDNVVNIEVSTSDVIVKDTLYLYGRGSSDSGVLYKVEIVNGILTLTPSDGH